MDDTLFIIFLVFMCVFLSTFMYDICQAYNRSNEHFIQDDDDYGTFV